MSQSLLLLREGVLGFPILHRKKIEVSSYPGCGLHGLWYPCHGLSLSPQTVLNHIPGASLLKQRGSKSWKVSVACVVQSSSWEMLCHHPVGENKFLQLGFIQMAAGCSANRTNGGGGLNLKMGFGQSDEGCKRSFKWFGFDGIGHWIVTTTIGGKLSRNRGLERCLKWWPCNEATADEG